jgi:hypothetical protein
MTYEEARRKHLKYNKDKKATISESDELTN